jgi:LVIVD repeat
MKEKYLGKYGKNIGKNIAGFSTLELMIAFALISIVLVAAVGANFSAQYWGITSGTANEGLYKAKTKLEDLRSLIKQDFYQAVSSTLPVPPSKDATDPADISCIAGGLCYYIETTITDLSSCSKYVQAKVNWRVQSYPTTTTALFTNLTNTPEVIARGGDCILNQPAGDWKNNSPQSVGSLSFTPGKQFTGIDVLHKKIYAVTNTIPSFLVYDAPTAVGQNPTLVGSYDLKVLGVSAKLNAIDAEEDLSTGLTYAFVAVNTTTSQLAVIDVTDSHNPILVKLKPLKGITSPGTLSEGWRVFVYGSRLYITTRETSGNELHIFDISTPTLPTEIGNGFQLNRTVNDFAVRDQKVNGSKRRLMFLASKAGTNELAVIDVTNDVITDINTDTGNPLPILNLPGGKDGMSVFILGNVLYFGRQSDPSGKELYAFDASNPTISLPIISQAEVGADVTNIEVSGQYAFIETPNQFQVWSSDYTTWASGKLQSYGMNNLSPLGFDIDLDWIYAVSSLAGGDKIQVLYTP